MSTRHLVFKEVKQKLRQTTELFAVVSCNLGRSYNPGPGTGATCRFADVFSVGSPVVVTFDVERRGIRDGGGRLGCQRM